ncbi:homogentisate 1,2-dioxygenase [Sphingosinicella soli]|uniref:Homogentisate 1,2-dioxygenase n=1 Tax=Sphingosinicella soli TaxID=333708 RepID=A0A7W7B3L6_9SPHN|nr:homogentisate 1,2-dioxygenase [Sphingosinicella soli]MBB4633384.1 homogentisate 1,2-dioxygenase [Sphingosinicella soli]
MSTADTPGHKGPPPGLHLYTRDGFVGKMCVAIRPHMIYEYSAVDGPHAPRRLNVGAIAATDRDDPWALPTPIASNREGVVVSVSARSAEMPYVFRNVECDEIHFIQAGEIEFITDFGVLQAGPGDFVALGRTITYRVRPLTPSTLRIVVETPEVLDLAPPAPFGMVNQGRDVKRPTLIDLPEEGAELWLKSFDGVTRYRVPRNPLACKAVIDGTPPAWKLNLRAIAPLAYPTSGGPPAQFCQSSTADIMFYTLSSRPPAGRPPQHHNADYDELIFYFEGPGAYGAMTDPGDMIWTPKGVTHWGPTEHVAEGYFAWLLETRGTMRLTDAALAAGSAMETGSFGLQVAFAPSPSA